MAAASWHTACQGLMKAYISPWKLVRDMQWLELDLEPLEVREVRWARLVLFGFTALECVAHESRPYPINKCIVIFVPRKF